MKSFILDKDEKYTKLIEERDELIRNNYSYTDDSKIQRDFGEVLDIESQKSISASSPKNTFSLRKTLSFIANKKPNIFSHVSNLFEKRQTLNSTNSDNPTDQNNNQQKHSVKKKKTQLNLLQSELMGMGFDLDLINKLMKYCEEVNTIELAIEYLTKTNDKWNHPFIYFENLEKDNVINDILENMNMIDSRNSNSGNKGVNNNNLIKCLVCDEFANSHLGYSKYKKTFEEKVIPNHNYNHRFKTLRYKKSSIHNKFIEEILNNEGSLAVQDDLYRQSILLIFIIKQNMQL